MPRKFSFSPPADGGGRKKSPGEYRNRHLKGMKNFTLTTTTKLNLDINVNDKTTQCCGSTMCANCVRLET